MEEGRKEGRKSEGRKKQRSAGKLPTQRRRLKAVSACFIIMLEKDTSDAEDAWQMHHASIHDDCTITLRRWMSPTGEASRCFMLRCTHQVIDSMLLRIMSHTPPPKILAITASATAFANTYIRSTARAIGIVVTKVEM